MYQDAVVLPIRIFLSELFVHFQKTYPVLPEPGMMHLSIYNGLKSLNSCTDVDMEISIKPENGEEINILLKDGIQEVFIPEENYNISVLSPYTCKEHNSSFHIHFHHNISFQPPIMVICNVLYIVV